MKRGYRQTGLAAERIQTPDGKSAQEHADAGRLSAFERFKKNGV
jgi:hypothetical protein